MLGIEPEASLTLAQARKMVMDYRSQVREGFNSTKVLREKRIEEKEAFRLKREQEMADLHTFRYCADVFITQRALSGYWKNNERGESVIRGYLRRHINPVIGDIPIAHLTPQDVFKVLQPFW